MCMVYHLQTNAMHAIYTNTIHSKETSLLAVLVLLACQPVDGQLRMGAALVVADALVWHHLTVHVALMLLKSPRCPEIHAGFFFSALATL